MRPAIIFDMDGTLFQTNLVLEPALEETFCKLRDKGFWLGDTPLAKYHEIMGVPLPVVWETLCPGFSHEKREMANVLFHKHLIDLIENHHGALYPDVEYVLAELSGRFNLYIASNGQSNYLQAITGAFGLERFIKKTYSIEEIPSGHKSDLAKKVIDENGIVEGAVVGDRLSDIRAAKDNKLIAVGVNFDFAQPEELAQADKVINSFTELLELSVELVK
ncbi:HAD hydrolase-like protein [Bacillus sp. FJAT-27245]|uniref:HAD hydrolase-like protein n=1 Tax=Bacillus sp. FJAT-27245 TaxID=1684144 RepID=UPI0006A79C74|nr:HAD hydrolase-like protein [Bacillus sp. FJAT-27245]